MALLSRPVMINIDSTPLATDSSTTYWIRGLSTSGSTKVFKGWVLDLAPQESRALRKLHSLKLITTRRYHAGRHVVDLRVNGETVASAAFELRV